MPFPWTKNSTTVDTSKNPTADDSQKKPEDQSRAEMEAFVSTMKTSFEEIVKPIREKVDSMETNWRTLADAAKTPPRTTETREPADPTLEPERWKAETLGPLAMQTATLRAEVTEERAIRNIPAEWRDVVEPQIIELLKGTPIERKIQTDYSSYIENCVNLVIGKEARKAGLRRDPQNKRFFIEDAASTSNTGTSKIDSDLGWTDNKGRFHSPGETLAKLGITEADFLKGA